MQQPTKHELIIVFRQGVSLEKGAEILRAAQVNYREGMDSSRGKAYFYRTGPKFILTFASASEKEKFREQYEQLQGVYEIYLPDWNMRKD